MIDIINNNYYYGLLIFVLFTILVFSKDFQELIKSIKSKTNQLQDWVASGSNSPGSNPKNPCEDWWEKVIIILGTITIMIYLIVKFNNPTDFFYNLYFKFWEFYERYALFVQPVLMGVVLLVYILVYRYLYDKYDKYKNGD